MKPQRPGPRAPRTAPSRADRPEARARVLALAIPALAAVLSYLPSLGHGFVLDDHWLVEGNAQLAPGASLGALLHADFWGGSAGPSGMWRPLIALVYWIGVRVGGGPALFHALNVCAHAGVSALVAALAMEAGLPALAAGAGALWFAVMPAHAESVAWVAGCTDLLSALAFLAALVADRRARRAGAAWCGPWPLVLLALALLAKEIAAGYVVVAALLDASDGPPRRPWSAVARWVAPAFALTAVWAVLHAVLVPLATDFRYFDAALREQARWAALTLLPLQLEFLAPWYAHSPLVAIRLPTSGTDPAVLGGTALLLAALALFGWLAWTRRRAAAPVALFLVTALPITLAVWSQAHLTLGERILYLPSAGAAWLLALLVARFAGTPAARTALLAACGVLVAWSAWATVGLVPAWHDDDAYFAAIVAAQPQNPAGHIGRAGQLARAGKREEALAELALAERINPQLPEIGVTRAMLEVDAGDWNGGLLSAEHAISLEPGNARAQLLRALCLLRLRRAGEALEALQALERRDPGDPDVTSLLGQCLFVSGKPAEAVPYLERAAAAQDQDPSIHFALGQSYAQVKRAADARREFERCTQLDPDDPGSWHRLADMCTELGDTAAAAAARARAAAITPAGAPADTPAR